MRTFMLAVIGVFAISACGSYGTSVVDAPKEKAAVASVSVSVPNAVVAGQAVKATATPKDATGAALTDRAIQWYSSSIAVATVDATGMVSAIAAGRTVVSAVSEGVSGTAAVDVTAPSPVPVASITVSITPATTVIGQTAHATASLKDAGGNVLAGRAVTWQSSDTRVATVQATGDIQSIAAGTTTITATSDGISNNAAFVVTAPVPVAVASVSVSPATASLLVGASTQLSAVTRDANNNVLTGRAISWTSSNTAAASVSVSGLVLAKAAGTSQISATSEGQTGTSSITVTVPPPASVATVSVSPANTTVQVGSSLQLSATTRDASGNVLTGRTVQWSSGNTAFATVDANSGVVTGVAAGSVTITATSEGKSGSSAVSVTAAAPPPTGSAEPPGMNLVTERPFSALQEGGWSIWAGAGTPANVSIVSDATAPKSPSSVGQMRYPAGLIGGGEPANVGNGMGGYRTVYVAMWVKLSPNWVANSSGVSKIAHIFINGLNRVYTSAQGNTTLIPEVRLQQLGGNYNATAQGGEGSGQFVNLTPNVAGQTGVQIIRGRWHKWELVLYAGSAGGADGTIDWWIDGVKVGHYTGVPLVAAGGSATWDQFVWSPTWGGTGGAVPAEQYMWMDHIYISGK